MTKVLVFSKSNPIKDWEAAKWNLQFLCVESQQEAIHMLETNTIHVVVVDIEMTPQLFAAVYVGADLITEILFLIFRHGYRHCPY